ncbi:8649_t:CDS:2 [Acaulospora morrowiae]|uniref:8649_t:CDS:1 n=1 Tax=Acaulospora morrowiae TaxID=94023 RepID=A0A9N8ZE39_9GLOM|nr:8649_t:CDS:2 [Acaulospora morrowiae]
MFKKASVNYKLDSLNKLLTNEPDNPKFLRVRGEIYQRMGKYEESLADLNRSLEIEPDNASTLEIRGRTYFMMGRYEEYNIDTNRSLEINITSAFSLESRKSLDLGQPPKFELNDFKLREKIRRRKSSFVTSDMQPLLSASREEEHDLLWKNFRNY